MYAGFRLVEVDRQTCRDMVKTYHYSHRVPGIVKSWGLEEEGQLAGCILFSIPASYTLCRGVCGPEYKQYVLELSRLVILSKTQNAASWLIGAALRQLGNHVVVSYADCNDHVGHIGYVYQATNWLYTGQGNAEPIWVHPTSGQIISYTRRHIDQKAAALGLDWKQLIKQPQKGKHRYVIFTGDRRFRKTARSSLRYPVMPFPKGATTRHEVSSPGKHYRVSCHKFTILVKTNNSGVITEAAPVVRRFIGQPLSNLTRWFRSIGGYKCSKL